jgi:hypothetical protein
VGVRKIAATHKGATGINRNAVISTLEQIKAIVTDCLKELGHEATQDKRPGRRAVSSTNVGAATELPKHILALRDKNFFKEPRTGNDVQQKLTSTYHCKVDRVLMALKRLNERKQPRKAAKLVGKRKQVAYVW